jgi:hypothetical protein
MDTVLYCGELPSVFACDVDNALKNVDERKKTTPVATDDGVVKPRRRRKRFQWCVLSSTCLMTGKKNPNLPNGLSQNHTGLSQNHTGLSQNHIGEPLDSIHSLHSIHSIRFDSKHTGQSRIHSLLSSTGIVLFDHGVVP